MPDKPSFPLCVFYDGSCSVCAREIEHYQRKDRNNRLIAVDISAPEFDPQAYGISLKSFMSELHCIDQEERVYRGVESFWAIWQAFPAASLYGLLGKIITLPFINLLARLCYRAFARMRTYLPKRKKYCHSGSCHADKH